MGAGVFLFSLASFLLSPASIQAESLPKPEALPDPTEPASTAQPLPSSAPAETGSDQRRRWLLTSTLVSPQRRTAVINGRSVKPGDTFDGVTVVKITLATVHLRDTQGEFSVTMQPAAVKIPSGRPETPQP